MSAPTITVSLHDLAKAVRVVKPHVHPDDTLPSINGYHLSTHGGALYVTGTDRYSVAVSRVGGEQDRPLGPFAVLIPAAGMARILSVFRPVKGNAKLALRFTITAEPATRSLDPGRLVVDEVSGDPETTRLVVTLPAVEFPRLGSIIRDVTERLAVATAPVPSIMLDPIKLARFAEVAKVYGPREPIRFHIVHANRAVTVTLQEDGATDKGLRFLGALMPINASTAPLTPVDALTRWVNLLDDKAATA